MLKFSLMKGPYLLGAEGKKHFLQLWLLSLMGGAAAVLAVLVRDLLAPMGWLAYLLAVVFVFVFYVGLNAVIYLVNKTRLYKWMFDE